MSNDDFVTRKEFSETINQLGDRLASEIKDLATAIKENKDSGTKIIMKLPFILGGIMFAILGCLITAFIYFYSLTSDFQRQLDEQKDLTNSSYHTRQDKEIGDIRDEVKNIQYSISGVITFLQATYPKRDLNYLNKK